MMTTIDFVMLGADIIIILGVIIRHLIRSKDENICNNLVVGPKNLQAWRYALYGSVLSSWFAIYLLFGYVSTLRYIFIIAFPYFTIVTLNISLPAWFCKLNNQTYMCNCDYYTYRDFELILVLGTSISILLIYFPLLFILVPAIAILLLIFLFIPKKKVESLNYPSELQINNEEELQQFLMSNSDRRKIIVLIHSGCDFCELQVNELNVVSKTLYDNIRVLDFTNGPVFDDFYLDYLNIERNYELMQFPATLIIDNGMSFDRRMGILSAEEMNNLLHNGV